MNRLIALSAIVLVMASCGVHEAKVSQAPVPNEQKMTVKLAQLTSPKDPVCGMDLTQELLEDTTLANGKMYGFCNIGCKMEFVKNPTTYLKEK